MLSSALHSFLPSFNMSKLGVLAWCASSFMRWPWDGIFHFGRGGINQCGCMSISNASWRRLPVLPVPAPLVPLGPVAAFHCPYLPRCSLRAVCTGRMHHGNLMTAVRYGDGLQPGSLSHAAKSSHEAGKWWGLGSRNDSRWDTQVQGRMRDSLSGYAWCLLYYCEGCAGSNGVREPYNMGSEETVTPFPSWDVGISDSVARDKGMSFLSHLYDCQTIAWKMRLLAVGFIALLSSSRHFEA